MHSLGTYVAFLMASVVLVLISCPLLVSTLATVVWELVFLAKHATPLLFKGNFWQKETGGGKGW